VMLDPALDLIPVLPAEIVPLLLIPVMVPLVLIAAMVAPRLPVLEMVVRLTPVLVLIPVLLAEIVPLLVKPVLLPDTGMATGTPLILVLLLIDPLPEDKVMDWVMVFCGAAVPLELVEPLELGEPLELLGLVAPPELEVPGPVIVPVGAKEKPPLGLAPELLAPLDEVPELELEPELLELLEPLELELELELEPELEELLEELLEPLELELELELPELEELLELLPGTISKTLLTMVRTSLKPLGWVSVIPLVLPTILLAATKV